MNILKIYSLFLIWLFWISISFWVFATEKNCARGWKDWLASAYCESHTSQSNPYSSDIDAPDLFNSNWWSDSVMARAWRFLMRVAVMLWIPLILFAAIKIALSFGDSWKMQESLKQIGMLILGLLIVLFSVMIVFLLSSLTRWNINLFNE